ncbi:2OG-Fe(II) oxygenase [Candidatus Pelagibacter sp. FZCC0015]|uniref:2OG-Fe(II) oxygenase n=1 Tax=Candidatus Pelagibacter sp. FZCC0015 TaxID=2268451 RepID=UPI0011A97AA3|nr:2OG-Fe(II) oxygenase [Candidatus Pelagibacter sp. FZCC0015]
MLKINRLKKIKSNFPVLVGDKVVEKNTCNLLIDEISKSKAFDDMIMGGRSRINKGSKNFNNYIKSSNNSAKLFKLFNSKTFYKKIETLFSKNFKDGSWTNTHKPKIFNQKKFTIKKKLNSSELKKLLGNNYTNPKVNLDIDFSVSKGGYRLRPHRDDITRLYNFLIYLTDIPKKNGGSLTIYRKKSKKNLRKSFRRFPKIGELEVVKAFTPKKGTVVFFQSTPNSYHGVKRFVEKNCPKRFFIYGSYALNKPVIWNYKGISYYPHIISTKKRMLTSFHDANYLTTAPKH